MVNKIGGNECIVRENHRCVQDDRALARCALNAELIVAWTVKSVRLLKKKQPSKNRARACSIVFDYGFVMCGDMGDMVVSVVIGTCVPIWWNEYNLVSIGSWYVGFTIDV